MVKGTEHTYHLHITGQVQGVGFRPFVWRLAQAYGLSGWVNNTTDGVHVVFNAGVRTAEDFGQAILGQAPPLSRITGYRLEALARQAFEGFQIVHSATAALPDLLLTPDFALCPECRQELHQAANRRFGYAFTTCIHCGPRFSIATGLPYDRERTTMARFEQCPECLAEYNDPADRRYFSQTNSCPVCGIQLRLTDAAGMDIADPLDSAINGLCAGKILAVKGIGGYLLMCDATNAGALQNLRARKRRPDKPFALLYADLEQLDGDALPGAVEKEWLPRFEAPIVLVQQRGKPASGLCSTLVAPGLAEIGVMLPYAPLLDLIARGAGRPLVATSGNLSGSPIIYDDQAARRLLSPIADAILSHNRDIALPQDDSVLRFSPRHRQKIVLRRSRGFAPTFFSGVQPTGPGKARSVLALGATLKSAFAWQHLGNLYVSQYLGDLESYDTQEAFERTLQHFLRLLRATPREIVVDKHPDYFSTQLGKRLAADWQTPVLEVQHHRAHFAAVLAENGYLAGPITTVPPVLGVIWDGTGFGDDGQVWGGEFFRFDGQAMERAGYFEAFDFLLGDKMPREPRLSALSLSGLSGITPDDLEAKFSPQEWALYQKILARGGLLRTTSVGRLFDGVAALLGLAHRVSYEGQAAMLLEQAAGRYYRQEGLEALPAYPLDTAGGILAPTGELVRQVAADRAAGSSREKIAARFHRTLVEMVRQQARLHDCRVLAFSGGVWQNALLVDLAIAHLRPEFELLFHRQLSPNDECIAYGQLMLSKSAEVALR
jgi:hydrogenase maturation protein HypF